MMIQTIHIFKSLFVSIDFIGYFSNNEGVSVRNVQVTILSNTPDEVSLVCAH